MGNHNQVGFFATAKLAASACLLLSGCGQVSVPSQAIFHPRGTAALHASELNPASMPIREKIYIPVYSSIHWSGRNVVTELSATISIRNADARNPLVLSAVTYYDSLGKPIQEYLDGVMELDPMATVEFVIERPDTRGGSGANFIVEWASPVEIAEPVTESIMLGQIGNAGISFSSPGRTIRIVDVPGQATQVP